MGVLASDSIFGGATRQQRGVERDGGKSSGSLSVFPEKERLPRRGEEDEKGSIAEQRAKTPDGKRVENVDTLLWHSSRRVREETREKEGERRREGKSRGSSQSSDRRAWNKTQLSPSKSNFRRAVTWKTFFWVKLVRPFKLSSRIANGPIVSECRLKKKKK